MTRHDDAMETMNEKAICDRLVEKGRKLFRAKWQPFPFTKDPEADCWLNDLDSHPHAFLLANVMNRQIKAEKAWRIPYLISKKLNGFSMKALSSLSTTDVRRLMSKPQPLHRFVDIMSKCFRLAVQRIKNQYAGDASRIWKGEPSSAEVVYRFLEFDGIGPKIANLAVNDLARRFKMPFSDYFSIDISADRHVQRVFARMRLCSQDKGKKGKVERVIYKARSLHPKFPGLLDFSIFEIGTKWCKARDPECDNCYMKDLCPTANGTE